MNGNLNWMANLPWTRRILIKLLVHSIIKPDLQHLLIGIFIYISVPLGFTLSFEKCDNLINNKNNITWFTASKIKNEKAFVTIDYISIGFSWSGFYIMLGISWKWDTRRQLTLSFWRLSLVDKDKHKCSDNFMLKWE